MEPYPNTRMLQIIEGERAGVPLPRARPGDERAPSNPGGVLRALGDLLSSNRAKQGQSPGTAGAIGRIGDVVGTILAPASAAGRIGVKAGQAVGGAINQAAATLGGGKEGAADPDCLLPSPVGCLVSRDTATLIGVNVLLLVLLVAGVLLIAKGPVEGAVKTVADAAP